jgi:hypothetical protein
MNIELCIDDEIINKIVTDAIKSHQSTKPGGIRLINICLSNTSLLGYSINNMLMLGESFGIKGCKI